MESLKSMAIWTLAEIDLISDEPLINEEITRVSPDSWVNAVYNLDSFGHTCSSKSTLTIHGGTSTETGSTLSCWNS